MRCNYCFYADVSGHRPVASHGIMSPEVLHAMLENIFRDLDDGDEITFAFQGGEPTLAGLPWYEDFIAAISFLQEKSGKKGIIFKYALQTNGLLLDQSWGDFLRKHNFLTGLSLDGGERFHDSNRRDARGEGTYRRVLQNKKLLEECQAEYNILCVLTKESAKYPDKISRFIEQENIRYIQFIPCLEGLNQETVSKNALRPAGFANFYSALLRWWLGKLEEGVYISVKFFDDVINLFFKGISSACGIDGLCHAQYIVEADGGVYPCDFYVLDEYRAGNLTRQTLREIFESDTMRSFVLRPRETPALCGTCSHHPFCRGGCRRMRQVMYYGGGAVCGYKTFLDRSLGHLEYAAKRFFNL